MNNKYRCYSGIAHIVDHIEDLFGNQAEGKSGFRVLINSRLNGPPHLGTLINYITGFVLAERLRDKYHESAMIIVELLDNLSDSGFQRNYWIDGKEFCKMDSVDINAEYARNCEFYKKVLIELSAIFDISFEIRHYQQIITMPSFRRSVLEVLRHEKFFSKQLQPTDGKLHIRIPCPICGLMQKAPATPTFSQIEENAFLICEECPKHGMHEVVFSDKNDTLIGINNTIRVFCRGLTLVDEDINNNTLSIIINGYDWAGTWPLQIHFSGMLYLQRNRLPEILYCPLIFDEDGDKMSKSKMVDNQIRKWIYNVSFLSSDQLNRICREVERWFDCTEDFFVNYSSTYFSDLLRA